MKIKQTFLLAASLMILSFSFAQGVSKKNPKVPVIIAESGIKNITVSDNIDLLLINASFDDVKASVPNESLDKVKITYTRGNLNISTKGYLPSDERITVYVYVDALESITLTGNAFAASRDILNLSNLKVNITDDARVTLRSRGKMRVNAPENYQKIEEERYHLVLSSN